MGLTHSPFVPTPPAIDAAAEEEEKEEERWAGSGASPSLPPRSHLTYTYVWCTRLRLPLAPGNEITITAVQMCESAPWRGSDRGDEREGLRTRKRKEKETDSPRFGRKFAPQ